MFTHGFIFWSAERISLSQLLLPTRYFSLLPALETENSTTKLWFKLARLDTHKSRIWLLRNGDVAGFWNYIIAFSTFPIPNHLHKIKKEKSICHWSFPLKCHLCLSMWRCQSQLAVISLSCALDLGFSWWPCSFTDAAPVCFQNNFSFALHLHAFLTAWEKNPKQAQVSLSPASQLSKTYIPLPSLSPYPAVELEMLLQTFMCSIVENHEQKSWLWAGKVWAESPWIMTWRSHCTERTEATQASGKVIISSFSIHAIPNSCQTKGWFETFKFYLHIWISTY